MATTLTIVDARDVSHQRTKSREVVLSEAKDIRAFSKSVRLSKEGIRGEKMMVEGEEVLVTAYCQCLPDFTVVVQTDKKETLRFGIQHWSHIRIGSGEQMVEYDFIPSTLNGLKKQLWKYFPTDEQIGRKEE